ncbi:MAG TPA: hypothetical protein VN310_14125 [Candidatus Dormibacteraeota bacterium]|nr:hypothetical protein [Candidatus Dormibacteraeota bacterium]
MKLGAILILLSALLPATSSPQSDSISIGDRNLIESGLRVGALKLGDPRARVLELFPKKPEDQEWENKCGTTIDWVDASNPTGRGDVFIRIKKDKVFQIESATTTFHTAEGFTTFDHPEKIASAYKDLKAYTLLTPPNSALGNRPLVFWIDKKRGVAFVFAYYPAEHKRYLYKTIIFEPNKNLCPEEETIGSPKWQAIPAYATEPPAELAPNL